jgi:hypothetical protein
MRLRKEAEIERCRHEAEAWIGDLTAREATMFVLGLYAGEGNKTEGGVGMANTNPLYLKVFVTWLREAFDIDESRLRAVLYLHEGLDLEMATAFWSELLDIPTTQFTKPYRAVPDSSIRTAKHIRGCPSVRYSSSEILRRVMAMIEAVTLRIANPG